MTTAPDMARASERRLSGEREAAEAGLMRLTVIGCGDAFGSGGRGNTCFLLETERTRLAVDFGATALVELKRAGWTPNDLDAIVLSHLHGDHFGGVPFLLLDSQFDSGRQRPLTVVGPEGTAARIAAALEVFFPGSSRLAWRFRLDIVDLPCGERARVGDTEIVSREVIHPSGAPATALRLAAGGRVFAYSGDTSWTEALVEVAAEADLFVVDCHDAETCSAPHLDLATLEANRHRLTARRVMLTHMSDGMLGRMDCLARKGFLAAHDGLVMDL